MTAVLGPGGAGELAALDARRNADGSISPDRISLHTAADAGSLDLVRVSSTHAEGAITCRRSALLIARDDEGLAGDGQLLVGGRKAGNPTAL